MLTLTQTSLSPSPSPSQSQSTFVLHFSCCQRRQQTSGDLEQFIVVAFAVVVAVAVVVNCFLFIYGILLLVLAVALVDPCNICMPGRQTGGQADRHPESRQPAIQSHQQHEASTERQSVSRTPIHQYNNPSIISQCYSPPPRHRRRRRRRRRRRCSQSPAKVLRSMLPSRRRFGVGAIPKESPLGNKWFSLFLESPILTPLPPQPHYPTPCPLACG